MSQPQPTRGPLLGVRVVDLTRLLPGPFCTWYLAALGAEVLRIDPIGGGDYARDLPPRLGDTGAFYASINRGKRSIELNVRDPLGAEVLHRLLAESDVLVEGFKPGTMKRSGLDPTDLLRRHPKLIIASISGYGQTGPLASEPGHDLNYQALSGALAAMADPGAGFPVQVADVAGGGVSAALAILAALFGRQRTGRGEWLDLSMTEGALALMGPHITTALADGRELKPSGELLTGGFGAYRCYRCSDGRWVSVGALEPKFMARMSQLMGLERPESRQEQLAAIFATRPRDEWVELLVGCCVAPALSASELPEHPQHKHRGSFVQVRGVPMVRAPFPWPADQTVASLGQDTWSVVEALGLDCEALAAAGVIGKQHAR